MRPLTIFCFSLLITVAACDSAQTGRRQDGDTDKSAIDKKDISDPWEEGSLAYSRWGSPASPHRDEERYIRFLDSLLACDSLPPTLRQRSEYRRRIAMLNRPGSIAADFRYVERRGGESRLHDLKSPLTLLIFYDPECPHCGDILRGLSQSETINAAIAEKALTVLAIYAEGKRDVWDKTLNDLPDNWLVGYDLTGILDEELYDLPAMPTPYLLDRDKRVILKDPTPRQLIRRLR